MDPLPPLSLIGLLLYVSPYPSEVGGLQGVAAYREGSPFPPCDGTRADQVEVQTNSEGSR